MYIAPRQLSWIVFLGAVLLAAEAGAQMAPEVDRAPAAAQNPTALSTPAPAHAALARLALARNPELAAARLRLEEAQGLLQQAGARPNPSLDITGTSGDATGSAGEREFSIEYAQTFELGGKRGHRVAAARIELELEKAEIADRERLLIADVRKLYAEYLAAGRKLENVTALLRLTRRQRELVKARHDAGEAAALELGLLEVEYQRLDTERTLLAGQAEQALLQVKLLAGLPLEENLPPLAGSLKQRLTLESLPQYTRQAIERRPDLAAARQRERLAEAELRLAQTGSRGELVVRGGYTHAQSRFDQFGFESPGGAITPLRDKDNILSGGISITLPLSDKNQGNIRAALARRNAARLTSAALERTVRLQVMAAYGRAQVARQALSTFSEAVLAQARKNLGVVRTAYDLGELRLPDVIAEQRRLLEIEAAYIDLERDARVADIELEREYDGRDY